MATTTKYTFYKPAVGEVGWGATFNTALDTADALIAGLAQNNTFTGTNTFENTVAVKNNVAIQLKELAGTARTVLTMTPGNAIAFGNAENNATANIKQTLSVIQSSSSLVTTPLLSLMTDRGAAMRLGASELTTVNATDGELWYNGINLYFRAGATNQILATFS